MYITLTLRGRGARDEDIKAKSNKYSRVTLNLNEGEDPTEGTKECSAGKQLGDRDG